MAVFGRGIWPSLADTGGAGRALRSVSARSDSRIADEEEVGEGRGRSAGGGDMGNGAAGGGGSSIGTSVSGTCGSMEDGLRALAAETELSMWRRDAGERRSWPSVAPPSASASDLLGVT